MARSYQDLTAARRARLAHAAQAQREVFEQADDVAVQVVELRERHGLTQTELAASARITCGGFSEVRDSHGR